MTNEEKYLLTKVLCERLPYNVKVRGIFFNYNKVKDKVLYEECDRLLTFDNLRNKSIKPYLRPMSSMTDEERKDLRRLTDAISINNDGLEFVSHDGYNDYIGYCFCSEIVDWLNAHHFDYRGLIPMGLALEATKDMYKEK